MAFHLIAVCATNACHARSRFGSFQCVRAKLTDASQACLCLQSALACSVTVAVTISVEDCNCVSFDGDSLVMLLDLVIEEGGINSLR